VHPVFQEQLRAEAEDAATLFLFGKLGSGGGCMSLGRIDKRKLQHLNVIICYLHTIQYETQ
jgi:hypothetical protein